MVLAIDDISPQLRQDFRLAMRRLAATITIVSAKGSEGRHGMVATAVTSLSADPPSLIACVNKSASIHDPIIESAAFCVNLLACGHEHLVPTFSGKEKGESRFSAGDWQTGDMDIPYLAGAQASLFCAVEQSVPYRSHSIFIGVVRAIRLSDALEPLIYQDGGFFKTVALAS